MLKGRILLSMESTSNRMSRLGKSLITDTELLSLEEIVERIDAVEAADLGDVAGDLFRLDRLSAAGIGPSEARFRAAIQRVNPALVGRAAA
jgi:predicted Zn-dependent peptidase